MNSANEFNRQAHESSPTTGQLTRRFSAFVACFLLAAHVMAEEPKRDPAADKAAFEKYGYKGTLTDYANAAEAVAGELNLPFIDLHRASIAHHNKIGPMRA